MYEIVITTGHVTWTFVCLFLLWGCGILSIFEWFSWRFNSPNDNDGRDRGMVIPGEEMWDDKKVWKRAKDLVQNNYHEEKDAEEKFHVGLFIKMTSGLEIKDLASQTPTKDDAALKTAQETLMKCMASKKTKHQTRLSFKVRM